mmetsp:Transcript_79652/g.247025  ORF Transcript_79652/g.247025 Transcript_79652/m.247025 type:complete len:97 (+) Transcript_79652:107-397(+)
MGASAGSLCAKEYAAGMEPMQITTVERLQMDRVDEWSLDGTGASELRRLPCMGCAAGNSRQPTDFVADTPSGCVIVEDVSEGLFLKEEMVVSEVEA